MTISVGINGFGRIGRATLAHISESLRNDINVVKINATGPIETAAHLMRYDRHERTGLGWRRCGARMHRQFQ